MSHLSTFLQNTVTVSAPKRSGGTLITRLLDNHPELIHSIDEGYFWEHAYNYIEINKEQVFVDLFKKFPPEQIEKSIISREILPRCSGIYKQTFPKPINLKFSWDREAFISGISDLKKADSISDIWNGLVKAYSEAIGHNNPNARTSYLFSGCYGRSLIATKKTLEKSKGIFIIRNPYYAMESLKKSRSFRNEKVLHPINFSQNLSYYFFFLENQKKILHEDALLIRFEDLVLDTENTMRKVANHIDIEFSKNMLHPTLLGKNWFGDSSFQKLNGVDKSTVQRKINTLTKIEIDFISQHLEAIINEFDYNIPYTQNR